MKSMSRPELIALYLETVENLLTQEEVAYSEALFASSEEERNSNVPGYNSSDSQAFSVSISKKLGLADTEESLSPDTLYCYLLVECLLWEEAQLQVDVLNDDTVSLMEIDTAEDILATLALNTTLGWPNNSGSILDTLRENMDCQEESEEVLVSRFCRRISDLAKEVAETSHRTLDQIVLLMLDDLTTLNSKHDLSEVCLKDNPFLKQYCEELLSSFNLRHKITIECLLEQAHRSSLRFMIHKGLNHTSAIKYAAFVHCIAWLPRTVEREEGYAQKSTDRMQSIDSRVDEVCKFIAKSLGSDEDSLSPSKSDRLAYQGRRYYELLYKSSFDFLSRKAIKEFGALLNEAVSSGPLSYLLDEVDRIAESIVLDAQSASTDDWILDFQIIYSHTSFRKEKETARSMKAHLPNIHRSARDGMARSNKVFRERSTKQTIASSLLSSNLPIRRPIHKSHNVPSYQRTKGTTHPRSRPWLAIKIIAPAMIGLVMSLSCALVSGIFSFRAASDSTYDLAIPTDSFLNSNHLVSASLLSENLLTKGDSPSLKTDRKDLLYSTEDISESSFDMLPSSGMTVANAIPIMQNNSRSLKGIHRRGSSTYIATWYGKEAQGWLTASGENFDANELTIAHPNLPFNTRVEIHDPGTNKSVVARVTDRPPSTARELIVLSSGAAKVLDLDERGFASVEVYSFTR